MKLIGVLCAVLGLGGCALAPSQGPLQTQLFDQASAGGAPRFDIVKVNDRVVATLQDETPVPTFLPRFKRYRPPPHLPIAVGDVLSVVIWESSGEGLFGNSTHLELNPAEIGAALAGDRAVAELAKNANSPLLRDSVLDELKRTAKGQFLLQMLDETERSETHIPDQQVGPDGGISIPYGGRIAASGRSPRQVERAIERGLAGKALDPQALVLVRHSDVNTVTVSGELIAGARIPIDPGGTRLLQVIAAAGGEKAPVRDTYVRLSRDRVTATVPLATIVDQPDEDVFVRPGDVLSLVYRPRVLSVFGAAGRNSALVLEQDRVSLGEALAVAGGLDDDRAASRAVFLLRYEPKALAASLGAPPVAGSGGETPVAYRLDMSDAKSLGLARRFPVRDKDVIYVADAPSEPWRKVFGLISTITSPFATGVVVCSETKC